MLIQGMPGWLPIKAALLEAATCVIAASIPSIGRYQAFCPSLKRRKDPHVRSTHVYVNVAKISAPETASFAPDIARVAPRELPAWDRIKEGMTLDQVIGILGQRFSFMGSHHSLWVSYSDVDFSLVEGKVQSIRKHPYLRMQPQR